MPYEDVLGILRPDNKMIIETAKGKNSAQESFRGEGANTSFETPRHRFEPFYDNIRGPGRRQGALCSCLGRSGFHNVSFGKAG